VEVVSPGDTAGEVEEKVQMWLAHGASLVWVIYPATRTVTAYRRDGSANVLLDDDLLDGEAVLPGFSFAVSRLFSVERVARLAHPQMAQMAGVEFAQICVICGWSLRIDVQRQPRRAERDSISLYMS
jgi:hypothetical protein